MVDAARLADELRAEQEHASSQEKAKRSLESSIAELDQRLAEANDIAAKGGRNAMAKLESRIRELEIELGSCQSKTSENYKAFQKAERRIKELQFQQDEDHKNQDRMGELANKLQSKIKTYKKQIEEAEEIAALNLAKYRKAQQELEEAEERSKMAGAQLSFARAGSVNVSLFSSYYLITFHYKRFIFSSCKYKMKASTSICCILQARSVLPNKTRFSPSTSPDNDKLFKLSSLTYISYLKYTEAWKHLH